MPAERVAEHTACARDLTGTIRTLGWERNGTVAVKADGVSAAQFAYEHVPDGTGGLFGPHGPGADDPAVKETFTSDMRRMTLFDEVIGNMDRNGGNYLIQSDGHVNAIDHGLTFSPPGTHFGDYNARFVFEGSPFTSDERAALQRVVDREQEIRNSILDDRNYAEVGARAQALLDGGKFPSWNYD